MRYLLTTILIISLLGYRKFEDVFIKRNLKFAWIQLNAALSDSPDSSLIPLYNHMVNCSIVQLVQVPVDSLQVACGLFELTGDQHWAINAKRFTESLAPMQFSTKSHDSGVMLFSSYGNAIRLTDTEGYEHVLINGAESLCK